MRAPAGDAAVRSGAGIRLERERAECKLGLILCAVARAPLGDVAPADQPAFGQSARVALRQAECEDRLAVSLHRLGRDICGKALGVSDLPVGAASPAIGLAGAVSHAVEVLAGLQRDD